MATLMKTPVQQKTATWPTGLLALLCALVPFHAFLTVWAGSSFGHYTAWRLWAEVLLTPLVVVAIAALWRDKKLFAALRASQVSRYLLAYVIVQLIIGAWALAAHHVTKTALADGLVLNLRLPAFFFASQVLASRSTWLQAHWQKIVLVPAAVVVLFGLLQVFVLPNNFLQHFGYGPNTILPYETVDQKLAYIRAQSTLRGPNPLGAYLVIVVAALAVGFAKRSQLRTKTLLGFGVVGTFALLAYTYSRSAYLGAGAAGVAVGWWSVKSAWVRRVALMCGAALAVIAGGSFLWLRHNDRFENTFFHTDRQSRSVESSNQARGSALEQGLRDVVREPFGEGPGTAGPASAHNTGHPARIAENYYLQIGQESGWLGLGLFAAINIVIARQLWERRTGALPLVLLASLVGITIINMLSHAWTDDTLAILWWSLAGSALAVRTKGQVVKPKAVKQ